MAGVFSDFHSGKFRISGFSALLSLNLQQEICEMPVEWEYSTTGQVHNISIPLSSGPGIFGEPLSKGDWIGVFYIDDNGDEVCGGSVQWNGSSGVVISAWGNDPFTTQKDGFATGEIISWKLFRRTRCSI